MTIPWIFILFTWAGVSLSTGSFASLDECKAALAKDIEQLTYTAPSGNKLQANGLCLQAVQIPEPQPKADKPSQ